MTQSDPCCDKTDQTSWGFQLVLDCFSDRPAFDTAELGTFRYAFYVDGGTRSEAVDVSCGSTAGTANRSSTNTSVPAGWSTYPNARRSKKWVSQSSAVTRRSYAPSRATSWSPRSFTQSSVAWISAVACALMRRPSGDRQMKSVTKPISRPFQANSQGHDPLSRWPAAIGILAFAWVELVYSGRGDPKQLAGDQKKLAGAVVVPKGASPVVIGKPTLRSDYPLRPEVTLSFVVYAEGLQGWIDMARAAGLSEIWDSIVALFSGRSRTINAVEREGLIRLVMEGHLRGIVGQLTVEQLQGFDAVVNLEGGPGGTGTNEGATGGRSAASG